MKPAARKWIENSSGSTPVTSNAKTDKTVAYRTRAPVQTAGGDRNIMDKIMASEVTVTTRDLLNVAPGVREQIKKDVTKRRMKEAEEEVARSFAGLEDKTLALEQEEFDGYADLYDDEDDSEEEMLVLSVNAVNIDSLPEAGHYVNEKEEGSVPVGAIVGDDVVLQYLEEHQGDDPPPQLFVARESDSLRTVYPDINGYGTRESVLDGGSQIVSMDRDVAVSLGISWDPDVKIMMQSANKSLAKTEGLARNVPFLFGETLTVYLQVHIIKNPAYDVLLGRPFDTLTKSVIKNAHDGNQTIVVTDPNSTRRVEIPTFAKGQRKIKEKMERRNFRDSMNC